MGGVLLWGSASWSLTQREKRLIRGMQLSVMRKVVGVRRSPYEDYIEWLRRATRRAKEMGEQAGMSSWLKRHFLAKWSWAGHVARMPDDRWAKKLTMYMTMFDGMPVWQRPLRARRGTFRRWENEIKNRCHAEGLQNWALAAQNKMQWNSLLAWASL